MGKERILKPINEKQLILPSLSERDVPNMHNRPNYEECRPDKSETKLNGLDTRTGYLFAGVIPSPFPYTQGELFD